MEKRKGTALVWFAIIVVVFFIIIVVAANSGNEDDMSSNINKGSGAIEYEIGQAVQVNGEWFYVIEDSYVEQPNVLLMTKENIDTLSLVQSSTSKGVPFSEEQYWEGLTLTYPYDLNEKNLPDISRFALRAAYDYGTKIGGKGRLLTYDEAKKLFDKHKDILFGIDTANGELTYWLGTACKVELIYVIEPSINNVGMAVNSGFSCGIRPVVEISKKLIY